MSQIPRCQIVPGPNRTASFQIDGMEKLCWNFDASYSRPFFYPVLSASGMNLVRMGHPGASNHDHHRGIWFAHHSVAGMDFWTEGAGTQILQNQWLAYLDDDQYAAMAVECSFLDGHDAIPLLNQQIIAVISPLKQGAYTLELQTTLTPSSPSIVLQQTNFGILAVRMAANLSAHFGGGTITNHSGKTGEPALFGKSARYIDYSGPVRNMPGASATQIAGITYYDHQDNINYPSKWHVREDGWMGASVCRDGDVTINSNAPLVLRYLLHIHDGPIDHIFARTLQQQFHEQPHWQIRKSTRKHRQFDIVTE
ncbi:MAG: PmoA family protein [Planctomycetota bacterium]|nr:PmoA family protein [Planctomycetota bacterium]